MGPELMLQMMAYNSSQQMVRQMMDNTIDEEARVNAFADWCERMDIDMTTLIDDAKRMREVMRMYKAILRTSK